MSDLVERLKKAALIQWQNSCQDTPIETFMEYEAADEIERLRHDLGKCREGSVIRTRINDKQVATINRMKPVIEAARKISALNLWTNDDSARELREALAAHDKGRGQEIGWENETPDESYHDHE